MNSKGLLSSNLALLYSSKPNGKLLSSIALHVCRVPSVLLNFPYLFVDARKKKGYERRKKGAWKLLEACDMHEVKKQGCHMPAVQQWQMAWAGPCCKLAMVG